MSNDLISRSVLIEFLKEVTVTDGITFDTGFKQIITDIKNQPTAYDVDKVVEQVEIKNRNILVDMYKYHGNNLPTTMTKEHNSLIVDIVKGGGVK